MDERHPRRIAMNPIEEIAPDVFRISVHVPEAQMQFNHFLVRDERPLLFHTGYRAMFPLLVEAVGRLVDPSTLGWIAFSHFEGDECGALNLWLERAPTARPLCTALAADLNVRDFAIREPQVLGGEERLSTGRHRFRMIATPHLPHGWDAGLLFEEEGRTLLCSDLFFQPGNPPAFSSDVVGPMKDSLAVARGGPYDFSVPYTTHTARMLEELAALRPATLGIMHGGSYAGDCVAAIGEVGGILREANGTPLR
jgi:flavorubredoxin